MKLLCDVHSQRETGQLGRSGDADCLLKRNGRYQLYLALSWLGSSNVDDDARPRPALVGNRKLYTDRAVLENERFTLSTKTETVRAAASAYVDGMLAGAREIGLV